MSKSNADAKEDLKVSNYILFFNYKILCASGIAARERKSGCDLKLIQNRTKKKNGGGGGKQKRSY